jgi:MFS family permease
MVGAFEAGFFPTAVTYLSLFYHRYDLGVRIALFYGQYAIAGAFSGAIAYGLFQVEGTALHNWQYLFIIEGGLTILFGVLAWFWLPNGPEDAWFLSADDRQYVIQRIARDSASYTGRDCESDTITRPNLSMRDARETFTDWKLYYIQVFNICASVPSLAFSVFLPLVVKGLGYSALQANLVRRIRSRQVQLLTHIWRWLYHLISVEQPLCISLLSAQITTENVGVTSSVASVLLL